MKSKWQQASMLNHIAKISKEEKINYDD